MKLFLKFKSVGRYFFAGTLAIIFLFLVGQNPDAAFACTLPPGGIPKYSVAEHVTKAQIVLEGAVNTITAENGFNEIATVTVKQYFKGGGPATLQINNFGSSAACLGTVKAGGNYIFYATGNPDSGLVSAYYFSAGVATGTPDPQTLAEILATTGQTPASPKDVSSGGAIQNPATTAPNSGSTPIVTTASSETTPPSSLTPQLSQTSTDITATVAPAPTNTIPLKNDDMNRILGIVLIGLVAGLSVIIGATVWRKGRNRQSGKKNR